MKILSTKSGRSIPKGSIRNNFQNPKFKCSKLVLNFDHSIFEFVSDFDIRISDLANLNKKESVS